MNVIKLVDMVGEILGAIAVTDEAADIFRKYGEMVFYSPPAVVRAFGERNNDYVHLEKIIFVRSYSQYDAAMLIRGSLAEFERGENCFFIPGYTFSKKKDA